jgi:hypothetical protein
MQPFNNMGISMKSSLFSTGCKKLKRSYLAMYEAYFSYLCSYIFFQEGLRNHMPFELTGLFYREPTERPLRCYISDMSYCDDSKIILENSGSKGSTQGS